MNNTVEASPVSALVATRREANDSFRRSLTGGRACLSAGILALGGEWQGRILRAVCAFDNFDLDDPWDDHSIGDIEVVIEQPGVDSETALIFFTVTNEPGGEGLLSLMLADEWWARPDDIPPCVRSENHE